MAVNIMGKLSTSIPLYQIRILRLSVRSKSLLFYHVFNVGGRRDEQTARIEQKAMGQHSRSQPEFHSSCFPSSTCRICFSSWPQRKIQIWEVASSFLQQLCHFLQEKVNGWWWSGRINVSMRNCLFLISNPFLNSLTGSYPSPAFFSFKSKGGNETQTQHERTVHLCKALGVKSVGGFSCHTGQPLLLLLAQHFFPLFS